MGNVEGEVRWEFTLRYGPTDQIKRNCLQRLYEKVLLSEVRRQIVPDSRSSWTEGSVAEVGARPTDENRTSVARAQSSWTGVVDEAPGSWECVQTTPGGPRCRIELSTRVVLNRIADFVCLSTILYFLVKLER